MVTTIISGGSLPPIVEWLAGGGRGAPVPSEGPLVGRQIAIYISLLTVNSVENLVSKGGVIGR